MQLFQLHGLMTQSMRRSVPPLPKFPKQVVEQLPQSVNVSSSCKQSGGHLPRYGVVLNTGGVHAATPIL